MSLELFYFITLCYGWHRWYQQRETPTFALKTLNTTQWFWLMGCILGCFGLLVGLLKTFSNSTVPLLDALTTVLSLAAQWLLCYKVMATWILWFVVDLLYAVLYFNKALPFHTILTISYTGLAIIGYWHWRKASQSPSIEITSEPTA